jgi:predicted kinase
MLTFIQMHGEPGSGKSTLARALGAALPALVVDKDKIATGAMRAGVPFTQAGAVAYEALWLLLPSLLEQGHSVIHDSPCYWPNIEQQGRAIAARCTAGYAMIEVTCAPAVIEQRLASRVALESNPTKRVTDQRPGMYRPSCPRLTVDGTRPLAELVEIAVGYIPGVRP